jgi:hypothetical protein
MLQGGKLAIELGETVFRLGGTMFRRAFCKQSATAKSCYRGRSFSVLHGRMLASELSAVATQSKQKNTCPNPVR